MTKRVLEEIYLLYVSNTYHMNFEIIIDRQVTNNTRSFAVPVSKTNQYRNSFFVDTIQLRAGTYYQRTQHAQRQLLPTCY